jgi:hypothetical protein
MYGYRSHGYDHFPFSLDMDILGIYMNQIEQFAQGFQMGQSELMSSPAA